MLILLPAKATLILGEIVLIHKFVWCIFMEQGLGKVLAVQLQLVNYREQGLGVASEATRGLSFGVLAFGDKTHGTSSSNIHYLQAKYETSQHLIGKDETTESWNLGNVADLDLGPSVLVSFLCLMPNLKQKPLKIEEILAFFPPPSPFPPLSYSSLSFCHAHTLISIPLLASRSS